MKLDTIINQPVIEAGRFVLRPLRRSDMGLIEHYGSDERVARMTTSIPHPLPPGATEAFVARAMAEKLGLSESQYTVSFQSRLGRTPWIKPYTDEILEELPGKGVKSLAVMIPSFTADCLETLEEIAMQGKESFEEAGGENYLMVPSLNSHPSWVNAVHTMISEYL